MKLVRLEEAHVGQKVAKDVSDARGNLLFKAGTQLTDDLVQRLRSWKVTHVFIEEAGPDALTERRRALVRAETIDQELDFIFAKAKGHPVMAQLRVVAGEYLKGRPS